MAKWRVKSEYGLGVMPARGHVVMVICTGSVTKNR
jgi:hypothetical protein